jgi:hypothetical protein
MIVWTRQPRPTSYSTTRVRSHDRAAQERIRKPQLDNSQENSAMTGQLRTAMVYNQNRAAKKNSKERVD